MIKFSSMRVAKISAHTVHMDKHSKVLESPRKMSLRKFVPFTNSVKIADIVKVSIAQNLDVICKVVEISDIEKMKEGGKEFRKQEVKVGDEIESCRLVLWEADVENLEDKSG